MASAAAASPTLGRIERHECFGETEQGSEATLHDVRTERLVDALGEGDDHHAIAGGERGVSHTSAATYHDVGSLSAAGGASSTSIVASCGPSITAPKVCAIAARSPHMNVW